MPRAEQLRTWVYRIRPSADAPAFTRNAQQRLLSAPLRRRRDAGKPLALGSRFRCRLRALDFVDGLVTIAAGGDAGLQLGVGVHVYACNRSMQRRYFATQRRRADAGPGTRRAAAPHRARYARGRARRDRA